MTYRSTVAHELTDAEIQARDELLERVDRLCAYVLGTVWETPTDWLRYSALKGRILAVIDNDGK